MQLIPPGGPGRGFVPSPAPSGTHHRCPWVSLCPLQAQSISSLRGPQLVMNGRWHAARGELGLPLAQEG